MSTAPIATAYAAVMIADLAECFLQVELIFQE